VIQSVALLSTALWWGSLSTVGFVVVPLLFAQMPSKQMAGQIAAQLFQYQAYVTWACVAVLLAIGYRMAARAKHKFSIKKNTMLVAGLFFSLAVYFVIAPQILTRQNLKLWHALGTALFAGQWLCATALLWHRGSNRA
jgi:predicted tellurium resistance membrane protein TerC